MPRSTRHSWSQATSHRDPSLSDPAGPVPRSGRLGSGWRLDASCRVLVCPRDRAIFVTAAENGFLMRIAGSEGQLLRRQRPASRGAAVQGGGHPGRHLDPRNMDVLVSRLRRKARDAGVELPLLAVRGCGYLFAEPLAVTPSSFVPRAPAPNARTAPQATPRPGPRTGPLAQADPRAHTFDPRLLAA